MSPYASSSDTLITDDAQVTNHIWLQVALGLPREHRSSDQLFADDDPAASLLEDTPLFLAEAESSKEDATQQFYDCLEPGSEDESEVCCKVPANDPVGMKRTAEAAHDDFESQACGEAQISSSDESPCMKRRRRQQGRDEPSEAPLCRGVYYDSMRQLWRANWPEETIVLDRESKRMVELRRSTRTKGFSARKYGFAESRELAISHRAKMINAGLVQHYVYSDNPRIIVGTTHPPKVDQSSKKKKARHNSPSAAETALYEEEEVHQLTPLDSSGDLLDRSDSTAGVSTAPSPTWSNASSSDSSYLANNKDEYRQQEIKNRVDGHSSFWDATQMNQLMAEVPLEEPELMTEIFDDPIQITSGSSEHASYALDPSISLLLAPQEDPRTHLF